MGTAVSFSALAPAYFAHNFSQYLPANSNFTIGIMPSEAVGITTGGNLTMTFTDSMNNCQFPSNNGIFFWPANSMAEITFVVSTGAAGGQCAIVVTFEGPDASHFSAPYLGALIGPCIYMPLPVQIAPGQTVSVPLIPTVTPTTDTFIFMITFAGQITPPTAFWPAGDGSARYVNFTAPTEGVGTAITWLVEPTNCQCTEQ